MSTEAETTLASACFGGSVSVHVSGPDAERLAACALHELHHFDLTLSRFRADSELTRLNHDPRTEVPASPLLIELIDAIGAAGRRSGGLVDGTLMDEIERVGYGQSMPAPAGEAIALQELRADRRERRPAAPQTGSAYALLAVDRTRRLVLRPTGLRVDSGGIGKGLAADIVAAPLHSQPTFCVNCGGDMLIGGSALVPRRVLVEHPGTGEAIHQLELVAGGVATSGISRRSWHAGDGRRAHHLLDPLTGEPAFTGIVQATAVADTASEAETLAKSALLAGPDTASEWLPGGGVLIFDDASVRIVEPRTTAPRQTPPL